LGVAYNLPPDVERIGLKPQVCGKGFHVECVFDNLRLWLTGLDSSGVFQFPVEGYTALQQVDPAHTSVTTEVKGKRVLTCMMIALTL